MAAQNARPGLTSRRVLPPSEYDRYRQYEDINKAAVSCAGCSYEPSDVKSLTIMSVYVVCIMIVAYVSIYVLFLYSVLF